MFRLREWSDRDREQVMAVRDAVYPEYRDGREVWTAAHQLDAPSTSLRYVVVIPPSQAIIAYAGTWPWDSATDRYRLDLIVHPRWQGQGVGGLLLDHCMQGLRVGQARSIQARVRDDHPESLVFLLKRGFVETQRMDGLALDVGLADPDLLSASPQRVASQNIALGILSEVEADDDILRHRLHDLHNAVLPDWPEADPAPVRPVSFADFFRHLAKLGIRLDDIVVAVDGGRFVGYCNLSVGTAVHPDYRGRGIATALKAFVIRDAQHRNVSSLFTCTANPAMRHVNEKLGYRHVRTEIRLVKQLRTSGQVT